MDRYFRTQVLYGNVRFIFREELLRGILHLKEQFCLERHGARSLERMTIHALSCVIALLLNALAVLNAKRTAKAISIDYASKINRD